jgi:hypothetical protein
MQSKPPYMPLTRRELLVGGSAWLAACRGTSDGGSARRGEELDALLAAHAATRPETPGAGANHYPMAAEALVALGRADAIPPSWHEGVRYYAGPLPRRAPPRDAGAATPALGDATQLGDWLDHFTAQLAHEDWRAVVAQWLPRLAAGPAAAVFHGAIRTAHAVRALECSTTPARLRELAQGLAYWAARYVELPVDDATAPAPLRDALAALPPPLPGPEDVPFDAVMPLLTSRPLAPAATPGAADADAARRAVAELVHEASVAFLEQFVQQRHRIWLLHTITAPAAVQLLLPHVDGAGRARLVAHTHQAIVAMFRAFGAPFVPRASVQLRPPPWPELVGAAAASGAVHTIKLIEALQRCERPGDPLARTIAVQWLAWR